MITTRRSVLRSIAATSLMSPCVAAMAEQYPSRAVRIIVPAGNGTGIDVVTRFFTDPLGARFRQPFIAVNRPGAGGLLGYTELTRSPPDGYTLILTGIPLYLLPLFSESGRPTYNPETDFAPVARVARVPNAIVVPANSPYQTLSDLLDAMRRSPGDLTYSSQGVGSTAHLCIVAFNASSRTDARHIPYRETSMAVNDVVGGRINFTCQSSAGILPLVQGGRLRILAVTNARRWEMLPDVPTVAEAGVPEFEVSSQLDFMAPAGTPEPVLQSLSDAICELARTPEFAEFCRRQAIAPEVRGHRELQPEIAREASRWRELVQTARLTSG